MSLQSVERVVRDHVGPQECAPGTAPVRVGDIWRVEAMPGWETEPRTAVVLRVHSGPVDFVQILLAHTCVEMATTDDAILEPDDTGLAHQLVVQPFLRGSVWQMQLTQLLSRVPHRLMKGIGQLYSPERPPEAVRTGAPDPGSSGARRRFEDSEREALQRRLITAPFLRVDSDQLLKQADDAQDDDCFEASAIAPSVELDR